MIKIEETKEIWKDIVVEGFEGLYQASNLGNIKSLQRTYWTPAHGGHYKTDPEKLLKPSLVGTYVKYKYVVFANNKHRKKFLVHRLIYEAFNGEIPEGYTIDHIDQNPLNNCRNNLRITTNSINSTNEENTKTTNDTGDKNLTNVPVANDEDESLVNNTNNPVSSIDDLISNSSKDDDSLV